jgi:hypothetical protein
MIGLAGKAQGKSRHLRMDKSHGPVEAACGTG